MKVTFNRKDLQRTMLTAERACDDKGLMPLIAYAKFDFSKGATTVVTTNLEETIKQKMTYSSAENTEGTSFLVRCKDLSRIVSSIKDDTVEFETSASQTFLRIIHRNGDATLPITDSYDFPDEKIDDCTPAFSFNITSSALQYIIRSAQPFTGDDELRPAMRGVLFEVGKEGVVYCATDAHMLVHEKIVYDTFSDSEEEKSFILTKNSFGVLERICSNSQGETLRVSVYQDFVRLDTQDSILLVKLIEGKFPTYRSVIPERQANHHDCSLKSLLEATKRNMICSDVSTNMLKFEMSGTRIRVMAENIDMAMGSKEDVACSGEGEITIGINGGKLMTALSTIDDENISMLTTAPNKAVTFSVPSHPNKVILIMPVLIQN